MKQILQHLKTGKMEIAELPSPTAGRGEALIQSRASLISSGTERMLVEFSQASLIQKARQQPDKVKQVLDKIKTDGLLPTLDAVFRKLDTPMPLGYCNCGVVLEAGEGVQDLAPGDRVISNGNHAEIIAAPRNLCAKVPEGIPDEEAAFTVLASIALQGVRLLKPELGETIMVFGMGLIGLLTAQLLRASGCEVLAVDLNADRLALAETFGAKAVNLDAGADPVASALTATGGAGVDGVIITASAKTDVIMHQAAEACRKRGRIILVGVVGLNLRRDDFYKKELTFQVSCSYGPGRYDETYEQKGQDYPISYVRWTEGRNFEAILSAINSGLLNVKPLITHRFQLNDALKAYDKVQNDPSALGIILEYPAEVSREINVAVTQRQSAGSEKTTVGVIGAGGFATGVLIPAISKTDAAMKYVAVRSKAQAAQHAAKKYGIEQASTDYRTMLKDPAVNAVFIITGHASHANLVSEALEADKHVFVEKPLALNETQLQHIEQTVKRRPERQLMVGFNRRFSPHIQKMKDALRGRSEPMCLTMTVNSGAIPADHWTQDPQAGGGRIIGEACHFIDLLLYLTGAKIQTVSAMMVGEGPAVREDKMSILLGFEDGSVGTINYFSNGAKSYPKETLEVFSDGRIMRMENFRLTRGYGFPRLSKFKTSRQDKGHQAEVEAFITRVSEGGAPLIPFSELANVTRASFAAVQSARDGIVVRI
ncbi:bi-domain-containing oxidoreductase [Candidatus Sumerlaeota bacterium]|nr:bi-domain-containing oxidoreductase [Candidatus Sumerlaeota bacterium]